MKELWARFKDATVSLFFWISSGFGVYFMVQHMTLHRARLAQAFQTPVDNLIPFQPFFVWPYITLWPAILLPFYIYVLPRHLDYAEFMLNLAKKKMGLRGKIVRFFFRCLNLLQALIEYIFGFEPNKLRVRKIRAQIMFAYLLAIVGLSFSHYFFPLKIERPQFNPVNLALWVLYEIYRLDSPNNIFPSLHATFAFLIFFIFNALRSDAPRAELSLYFRGRASRFALSKIGFGFYLWACLIVASTYFVKQHFIIDGVAGFFLAYAAFKAGFSERFWTFLSSRWPKIFPQIMGNRPEDEEVLGI